MSDEKKRQVENYRTSIGIEVPMAAIAGSLFGVGNIFLKMATAETGPIQIFSTYKWSVLFSSLSFWATVVIHVGGVMIWLWALYRGRVALIAPVLGGFVVFTSVVAGLTYFGEPLTPIKGLGILAVTSGSMILSRRH